MANRSEKKNLGFETRAIRTQADRSGHREHSSSVYLTSSFLFDSAEHGRDLFSGNADGLIYSRYGNPNVDEFVEKLCLLEECEDGVATATGMAAVFLTFTSLLSAGDHIVASRALFGSTHRILTAILPRFGITASYPAADDPASLEAACTKETKMMFVETPSNPGLKLFDISACAEICRHRGLILAVDNCFAGPYLQNPAPLGADVVIHSATKFIDGQGRVLGGAVLGSGGRIEPVRAFARQTGPSMSPFNAWVLSKSLETLGPRMDRHCSNALAVAKYLEDHPSAKEVRYPFLPSHPQYDLAKRQMRSGGGLVTFCASGGTEAAMQFVNRLQMISRTSNLGDSRSIATHPASTTHSSLTPEERRAAGIEDGTIRISVGLETAEDIIDDIAQALG